MKINPMKFIIAVFAVFWATSASAQYADYLRGSTLLTYCESDEPTNDAVCVGYVAGVVAMGTLVTGSRTFALGKRIRSACIPPEANSEQLIAVVVKYLRENPEELHLGAAANTWTAMATAFPCD